MDFKLNCSLFIYFLKSSRRICGISYFIIVYKSHMKAVSFLLTLSLLGVIHFIILLAEWLRAPSALDSCVLYSTRFSCLLTNPLSFLFLPIFSLSNATISIFGSTRFDLSFRPLGSCCCCCNRIDFPSSFFCPFPFPSLSLRVCVCILLLYLGAGWTFVLSSSLLLIDPLTVDAVCQAMRVGVEFSLRRRSVQRTEKSVVVVFFIFLFFFMVGRCFMNAAADLTRCGTALPSWIATRVTAAVVTATGRTLHRLKWTSCCPSLSSTLHYKICKSWFLSFFLSFVSLLCFVWLSVVWSESIQHNRIRLLCHDIRFQDHIPAEELASTIGGSGGGSVSVGQQMQPLQQTVMALTCHECFRSVLESWLITARSKVTIVFSFDFL